MKIDVIGQIWNSLTNGMVYGVSGLCPTLCVGAHSGVQPKVIILIEE